MQPVPYQSYLTKRYILHLNASMRAALACLSQQVARERALKLFLRQETIIMGCTYMRAGPAGATSGCLGLAPAYATYLSTPASRLPPSTPASKSASPLAALLCGLVACGGLACWALLQATCPHTRAACSSGTLRYVCGTAIVRRARASVCFKPPPAPCIVAGLTELRSRAPAPPSVVPACASA